MTNVVCLATWKRVKIPASATDKRWTAADLMRWAYVTIEKDASSELPLVPFAKATPEIIEMALVKLVAEIGYRPEDRTPASWALRMLAQHAATISICVKQQQPDPE